SGRVGCVQRVLEQSSAFAPCLIFLPSPIPHLSHELTNQFSHIIFLIAVIVQGTFTSRPFMNWRSSLTNPMRRFATYGFQVSGRSQDTETLRGSSWTSRATPR